MKKIAIIGYGAIAQYVFNTLKKNDILISSLICRKGREKQARSCLNKEIEVVSLIKDFKTLPSLILDCAGHKALKDYAPEALNKGIDFITLSAGALADDELLKNLKKAATSGKSNFYIASGAVGGLDLLTASKQGELKQVTYIGRKPPKGWLGSRAEEIINLSKLKNSSEIHFSGTAREAAKLYPKNANVAASIALAGIGLDKTKVKLIADGRISKNIHEIEIIGKFGISTINIQGVSLPSNPKSSALAAMSMVAEVRRVLDLN